MIDAAELARVPRDGFGVEVGWARLQPYHEAAERQRFELMEARRRGQRVAQGLEVQERKVWTPTRERNVVWHMARESYHGAYEQQRALLGYIGFEIAPDLSGAGPGDLDPISNVLAALDWQLRITFDPQGNNREKWWYETPKEARRFLRRRVFEGESIWRNHGGPKRREYKLLEDTLQFYEDGEKMELWDMGVMAPEDLNRDLKLTTEREVSEILLADAIRRAEVPKRRADVILTVIHFFREVSRRRGHAVFTERTRNAAMSEAIRETARRLGISAVTVRRHLTLASEDARVGEALRNVKSP